jgi:hypothetical protein
MLKYPDVIAFHSEISCSEIGREGVLPFKFSVILMVNLLSSGIWTRLFPEDNVHKPRKQNN